MDLKSEVLRLAEQAAFESDELLPRGADPKDLDLLARRIGNPLPGELVDWLTACNGPLIGPGGIFGVREDDPFVDIWSRLCDIPEWRQKGWIPVAGDGSGDYYVLDAKRTVNQAHPIYFIDQSDFGRADYIVASGLWSFIRFLLRRDLQDSRGEARYWPFDKKQVLAEDPGLSNWTAPPPLPWDADEYWRIHRT